MKVDTVESAAATLADTQTAKFQNRNSKSALIAKARAGQLAWKGALLLIMARSALMIVSQALAAGVIWIRSASFSWNAAAKWWTIYGTLVDLGCLALMLFYTRKEQIRLRDLIGHLRLRWGCDLFLGLGCLLLVLPFFIFGFFAASRLVYGVSQPPLFAGLLSSRLLPTWAVLYSWSVWLLLWSPTEEMTYNGFALPRLEVLAGSRWKAIAIVAFWWALQHSFIPFLLDWKYVVWRFLSFLPGVVVFLMIYLRVRSLPPLILAHWCMDSYGLVVTLRF